MGQPDLTATDSCLGLGAGRVTIEVSPARLGTYHHTSDMYVRTRVRLTPACSEMTVPRNGGRKGLTTGMGDTAGLEQDLAGHWHASGCCGTMIGAAAAAPIADPGLPATATRIRAGRAAPGWGLPRI